MNKENYRFGFNGQVKDNNLKGIGNSLDFSFRIHDSRLGRFLSVDPLASSFPWNSTYAFAENDVVRSKDLEGLEKAPSISAMRDNTSAHIPVMSFYTLEQEQQIRHNHKALQHYSEYVENEKSANLEDLVFSDIVIKRKFHHQQPPEGVVEQPMTFRERLKAGFNMASPAFLIPSPYMAAKYGIANTSESVWSMPPSQRGFVIEEQLGGNLPRSFPTIDRFSNGVATCIKSIDLNAATYQNTGNLSNVVNSYINNLANFKGANWGGVTIETNQITNRVLDIAIPSGATTEQMNTLNQAASRGASQGVNVNIIQVH